MSAAHAETTPEDAAKELARYHIVDVREASEFQGPLGHLEGAQLIALGELEGRAGEIPADAPLLMVCRSGNRSGKACDALARLGRPGAVNLVGGMIAWHAGGLPVVRSRFKNGRAIRDAFATWLSQVKQLPPDEATARVRAAYEAERDEESTP
jgi:rhodanese-related sulfurtransferase